MVTGDAELLAEFLDFFFLYTVDLPLSRMPNAPRRRLRKRLLATKSLHRTGLAVKQNAA
jgi:hypothetical protein